MSAKAGQEGGGEGAFEAKRREIAAADRFYLRPRIQMTIGNDGVLHAYVYLMSESWYPDSPGFIPRASVRGDRRGIHDLPNGGKYHAAIRLSPADAQDLQRAGRDLAGDRIFFRVLKGRLQANGLPSFVLEIDRLEVGFQGQVVGITPSQSKDNLEGRVQGSGG